MGGNFKRNRRRLNSLAFEKLSLDFLDFIIGFLRRAILVEFFILNISVK